MKTSDRNVNIELLRILSALMVLTYHVINTCVDLSSLSTVELFFAYNILWGGGRMAVNIFIIISAWYLCDLPYKSKRIAETWVSVFAYSLIIGIIFYFRQGNISFLVNQLFPISNSVVWFISVYLIMLLVSPFLNYIIKNYNKLRILLMQLIILNCVIPTVSPKFSLKLSNIGWFCLLYLIVGEIKNHPISWFTSKINCLVGFLLSWIAAITVYHYFPIIVEQFSLLSKVSSILGMNKGMYFSQLGSIPCLFGSLCIFYLFKDCNYQIFKNCKWIYLISGATLDVYVLLAMNGPGGRLFWVDLFNLNEFIVGKNILFRAYLVILLAFVLAVILGNIRKIIIKPLMESKYAIDIFSRLDSKYLG